MLKLISCFLLANVLVNIHSAGSATPATPAPAATPAPEAATPAAKGKKEKTPKPTPTPRPARTTAAADAKYDCGVCTGEGDDCKPDKVDRNCEFCSKITGTAEDPNKVPNAIWNVLAFANMGDIKGSMAAHKGKKVTMRKGAPKALIALAGQNFQDEGCSNFTSLLGLKDATACLCKGDCPENL